MEKVIMIPDTNQDEKKKPVEFTHDLTRYAGWSESESDPRDFEKVIYLGRCKTDGDMFACYSGGSIYIRKGHLNSGEY